MPALSPLVAEAGTLLLNTLVGRGGSGWGAQKSGLCRLVRLGFRACFSRSSG